jgi:hypothetical protein
MSDESAQRTRADRPPRDAWQDRAGQFLKRIRQMFGGR